MQKAQEIRVVSDSQNKTNAVLVPIELWHEIASEKETAYLLQIEARTTAYGGKEIGRDFGFDEPERELEFDLATLEQLVSVELNPSVSTS